MTNAPPPPAAIDSPRAPTDGSQPASRVRWRVFGLAFATSGILYWHRYVFGFVKPTLAEEWKLTNTELGRLDSAFSLSYTFFQFPLGVAADLAGVHCVLSGLTVLWCAGLALLAVAPSSGWIWLAQATIGTGQSAVYACLSRVARVWYPPRIRTTLQGLVGVLAGRLGALSSSLVFSSLLLGWLGLSWRTSVGILAAIGFAHAAVFAALFRDSPRRHPRVNAEELAIIEGGEPGPGHIGGPGSVSRAGAKTLPPAAERSLAAATAADSGSRLAVVRSWWRRLSWRSLANVFALGVQTILSTFADNIYASWLPLFLRQTHGLEFKEMGFYSALPLLGGALAGIVGGQLNDRLIARTGSRRFTRSGVALVGKSIAAIVLVIALRFYD
ncbi:MAG: MFS transporter, partial [Planctomycetota bacterium]